MKYLLIALFMVVTVANSQIFEVSQLFNRKLTKVQKEQIGTLKSFYGHIALDETKKYDIVSRFDGFITKLYANEQYKMVKIGEPLFEIYSDEISAISKEIKISKKFNPSLVQNNIQKLKSLDVNPNIIKKILNSKKILDSIKFFSPTDSIILQKKINQGSFAKKGALLLQLASLDKLWVIASVYQKDLSFIKKGMPAKIYVDGIEKAIDSKVDLIYPNLDPKTKSVDVRFVISNDNLNIYPNMFSKVTIKEVSKQILTLPKTAVLRKGTKFFVFQYISKTEFEPIEIKAKRIASNKYEILEGLSEGVEVIDNALFLIDSDAITNGLYTSDDEDW